MFPDLRKLFEFIYNFSVYNACYPDTNIDNAKKYNNSELFFIKEYYYLRNTTYDINIDIESTTKNARHLRYFNFFDAYYRSDGTLLHSATEYNMQHYVELLLKDKFDYEQKNRRGGGEYASTPLGIAERHTFHSILAKFNAGTSNIGNKNVAMKSQRQQTGARGAAIKEKYYQFKQQLLFARYFLMLLGCNIRHTQCQMTKHDDKRLYVDFGKFNGLTGVSVGQHSRSNSASVLQKTMNIFSNINGNGARIMDNVVKGMIGLLEKKLVISDDLLVLCMEYCHNVNTGGDLLNKFLNALQSACNECLMHPKDDDKYKRRNHAWFEQFLLFSNIWLCKTPTIKLNNKIDSTGGNESKVKDEIEYTTAKGDGNVAVLYDLLDATVNEALKTMQKYIWSHVGREIDTDKRSWDVLSSFGEKGNGEELKFEDGIRQDSIKNGIKSEESEIKLYETLLSMDKTTNNYDVFSECNNKKYVTNCLLFAHSMSNIFENEIRRIFKDDKNCIFEFAPVKTYERCVIKAQVDYSNRRFPNAANVLDYLRCSITYDSTQLLLDGLNKFISHSVKSDILKEIVRIKNGFKHIIKWQEPSDARYCDVKCNIIIMNPKTKEQMVAEVQFLLKWLLTAKKMGHKCYEAKRRAEFINIVKNEMYTIDENYQQYNVRIRKLFENKDSSQFIRQTLLQPNMVLSMILSQNMIEKDYFHSTNKHSPFLTLKQRQENKPLLYYFGYKQDTKLGAFLLSCLFHFSEIILGEVNSNSNSNPGKLTTNNLNSKPKLPTFLCKYLNFHECQYGLISKQYFVCPSLLWLYVFVFVFVLMYMWI